MTRGIRLLLGVLSLLSVSVLLGGCGGTGSDSVVRSSFVEFTPEQQQEIAANASRPYRIQPHDKLKVGFLNHKELDQEEVLVLPDGAISMVGVDRLAVAGLTITEADSALTAEYAKEYRDPNISVIVRETSGLRVYVLGEVNNPGMQKMTSGGVNILGAVSMAGGFTDDASESNSVLVRVTPTGYLVKEVDLSEFYRLESIELATVHLLPNDIIYVPRSAIGDFGYFSKTVLSGLLNITRMAADINYLAGGAVGRY